MKTPENLVRAVERLKPQAVLLLDTNILMDNPRLESYDIAAPGLFLLVVPEIAYKELMTIKRGGKDERTKQRASRALNVVDAIFRRGNPVNGIELENGHWVITVKTPNPSSPREMSIEDDQNWGNLGRADTAFLRLAHSCAEDVAGTPTLLVTRDNDLRGVARVEGVPTCPLRHLRSPEELEGLLADHHSGGLADVGADFSSLLDSNEERPVEIALTLEELKSEGEYLIASGAGRLTYDKQTHPFRWTFPYRNLAKAEDFDSMWEMAQDAGSMPVENVDFMGADEKIPEPVRRLVCILLEASASYASGGPCLQSPLTRVRLGLGFLFDNEWGEFIPIESIPKELYPDLFSRDSAELEAYSRICARHNQHILSLRNGTAKNVGDTYIKVFRSMEELAGLLGGELEPEYHDQVMATLESGLSSIIEDALDTWSVGETQEMELSYRPFEWSEEGENNEDYEEYDDDESSESED